MAPGLAWLINTARNAGEWGIKPGSPTTIAYERELERAVETMREMHRRGIRVLIGGDYGFAWTPMGTNAKDFEYFVDLLGMSPMEAIQAGTRLGGEIMGMGNELGLVREGYLADLLLVDGRPQPGCPRATGSSAPARHHEGRQVPQGPRERHHVHACLRVGDPRAVTGRVRDHAAAAAAGRPARARPGAGTLRS